MNLFALPYLLRDRASAKCPKAMTPGSRAMRGGPPMMLTPPQLRPAAPGSTAKCCIARQSGQTALDPSAFRAARAAAETVERAAAAARGADEPRIANVYGYLAACAVVRDAHAAAIVLNDLAFLDEFAVK